MSANRAQRRAAVAMVPAGTERDYMKAAFESSDPAALRAVDEEALPTGIAAEAVCDAVEKIADELAERHVRALVEQHVRTIVKSDTVKQLVQVCVRERIATLAVAEVETWTPELRKRIAALVEATIDQKVREVVDVACEAAVSEVKKRLR